MAELAVSPTDDMLEQAFDNLWLRPTARPANQSITKLGDGIDAIKSPALMLQTRANASTSAREIAPPYSIAVKRWRGIPVSRASFTSGRHF